MKTYYFSAKNIILKSVVGLLGLTVVSCGSYQNASYYDNDGIYASKKEVTETKEVIVTDNSATNKYKDYFGSNANKYSNDNDQVFTDVDSYTSTNDTIEDKSNENYSSWGSNDRDVTINVYGSNWGWGYNYWNWRSYWGYSPYHCGFSYWNDWYSPYWGYSGYYGPSWGWGWNYPYYGGYYGYNNWYGNGYYGNNYAYADGRRGVTRRFSDGYNTSSRIGSNRNFGTGGRRNSSTISPSRNYSPSNNNSSNNRGNYPRRNSSDQNVSPRTFEPRRSEPRRSESPRSYESPRSSSYDSSPRSSSGSSSGSGSYGGSGRTGGRRG